MKTSLILSCILSSALLASCGSTQKIDIAMSGDSLPVGSSWTQDSSFTPVPLTESTESLCTKEYAPVCWSDGETYSNRCVAESQKNLTVAYVWECSETNSQSTSGSDQSEVSTSGTTIEKLSNAPEKVSTDEKTDTPPSGVNTPRPPVENNTASEPSAPVTSDHAYENAYLSYGYTLPKYTYYRGYGARDWADHTLAISLTASGIESFEGADVRVYYYRKTPSAPASGKQITLSNGATVVVEKVGASNAKIDAIETMIMSTVHVIE